ncbi:MAG TPA: hypothetical protein PLZ57_04940 [Pseudobdellovibrionaceae bacterium]|nr:hypothetical protein [Pseudobdellovibrionaceae bacterium]
MRKWRSLKSQLGISLVEVIVALGVGLALTLGITNAMTSSMRESQYINQKLSVVELERLMISALADGSVCTFTALNDDLRFNANSLSTAVVDLPEIKLTPSVTAPILVKVGDPMPGNQSVVVSSIRLEGFELAGTDVYKANLIVQFDPSRLVRAIRPISLREVVYTEPTTPLASKRIIKCGPADAPSATPCKMVQGESSADNNLCKVVSFPANSFSQVPYVLTSPSSNLVAAIGVRNVTTTGFEACGQLYNGYSFRWVAFAPNCF